MIKLRTRILGLLPILISFFCLLLLSRSFEIILVQKNQFIEGLTSIYFSGIANDILFTLLAGLVLFLLPLSKKGVRGISFSILGIIIIFSLISSFYFVISLQPLDRVLYQFSLEGIGGIISDFGEFQWYYLLLVLPIPLIFLLVKLFTKTKKYNLAIVCTLILILIGTKIAVKSSDYNELQMNLAKNNASLFMLDSYDYFSATEAEFKVNAATTINNDYPYLRFASKENPLEEYFDLKETPPNVVFLIVESLSSAYSGNDPGEISFTPFLDSLAKQSIYFSNFLATADRTFAALPSSLASLPHGQNGFSGMQLKTPEHHSIPSILTNNKYKASFFYGGDSKFDFMKTFLEVNGVKKIFDHSEFNYEGTEKKLSKDDVPFGVGDRKLFEEAAKIWSEDEEAPFLHIYLTLSMHFPFKVENQKSYIEKAKTIINNSSNSNNEKYEKYLQLFSTSVYTDEALGYLMREYKKQAAYENTIFFIYGDHMFGPIPKKDRLEKYEVPLIVFSPLLKKTAEIKAINTHYDIAPSLISLLENKYELNTPEQVHWLGEAFNMSTNVEMNREMLFMVNNRSTDEFLSGDKLIVRDKLFQLDSNLRLSFSDDKEELKRLLTEKNNAEYLQKTVVNENRIVPSQKELKTILKKQFDGMTFSQENEYIMLIDKVLSSDTDVLQADMELEFQQEDETAGANKQPILVGVLKNGKTVYSWEKIDYEKIGEKTDKGYKIKYSTLFKANSTVPLIKGDNIKIYFWNKEKTQETYKITKGKIELKTAEK